MKKVYSAIGGKKKKAKSGVFVCPSCGNEHWSIMTGKDEVAKCVKCGKVLGKTKEELDKLIVEKEVDAYVCPRCGIEVEDTPENYTGGKTIDGKMAILCPKCFNFVNGLPLIHHGHDFGNFEPFMTQTDYFLVQHKPCKDKKNKGLCDTYACVIDNIGRVIFNVQCLDCQAVDAVKTHVPFGGHTPDRIFLSPKLRSRIGTYED